MRWSFRKKCTRAVRISSWSSWSMKPDSRRGRGRRPAPRWIYCEAREWGRSESQASCQMLWRRISVEAVLVCSNSPIRMMFLMLTARICGKLVRNSDIIITFDKFFLLRVYFFVYATKKAASPANDHSTNENSKPHEILTSLTQFLNHHQFSMQVFLSFCVIKKIAFT